MSNPLEGGSSEGFRRIIHRDIEGSSEVERIVGKQLRNNKPGGLCINPANVPAVPLFRKSNLIT